MKYTRLKSAFIVVELIVLAVAVSVWSSSCKTLNPPLVDDVTNIAADCGKPAIRNVALHILDDVTSALVTTDYGGGIRAVVTDLVRGVAETEMRRALDEGWQAASCAVEEIQRQAGVHINYGRMDDATTERQAMIRAHATAWLAGHK